MLTRLHSVAGGLTLVTILTFLTATVLAEGFGAIATVQAVKTAIPWGFLVLIPVLAATGGSGVLLARERSGVLVDRKRRRMAFAAANGLVILVPSALLLSVKAQAGEFDGAFVAIQALELIAGGINLLLLGLNLRDGLGLRLIRRHPR